VIFKAFCWAYRVFEKKAEKMNVSVKSRNRKLFVIAFYNFVEAKVGSMQRGWKLISAFKTYFLLAIEGVEG